MYALVCDKVAFEGGHLRFVKEGRVGAAPEIPEVVACSLPRLLVFFVVEGHAHLSLYAVQEFARI